MAKDCKRQIAACAQISGQFAKVNEGLRNRFWRRGRDSNPRYACAYSAFRVRRDRPLCHLSGADGAQVSPQGSVARLAWRAGAGKAPRPRPGLPPLSRTIAFALDRLHRDMRHQRHGFSQLPGELRVRGVAVERTLIDALVDRNAAKETEGDEEGPVGDVLEPHSPAIGGDIFGFGRYAAG